MPVGSNDAEIVWERVKRSRAAIGTLLLNQSVIAGVGNVYRAEILFLLGIHPEKEPLTAGGMTRRGLCDLGGDAVHGPRAPQRNPPAVAVQDQLPKSNMGKILKKDLKADFAGLFEEGQG